MINQLVDGIFGTEALASPLKQKMNGLIKVLKEHPFLLVWDNFESASGLAGTEVRPMLSEDDRGLLKELLSGLRGGKTKVLITSRSTEKWLATGECFRLPLSGLHGEELWQFCNQVLRDLGLRVKRDDEDFRALIEELDGHPLALRTVLLQLKEKNTAQLLADLRKEFALLEGDESSSRILAALAVLDKGLPEEYGPVLQLIGLHQRFVDQDVLEQMLKSIELETAAVQPCFTLLDTAGLIQDMGDNIFWLHPALQSHLERQHPPPENFQRIFADLMGSIADYLTPKELHEQRVPFFIHGANFHHALKLAQQLGIEQSIAALIQALASYAKNNRHDNDAEGLLIKLVAHHRQHKNHIFEAKTYHQLGMIAERQRDVAAAIQWYKKSLKLKKKYGDTLGTAITYHQLGGIALAQKNFAAAKKWCKKSLSIKNKQDDEKGAASTYYQLGRIAQEKRNFFNAEQWYEKSLAFFKTCGDKRMIAMIYHQLGRTAQEQHDFATARTRYLHSLEIKEEQKDEYSTAMTCHQLGIITEEQDVIEAEKWYRRALVIAEKQNDQHLSASSYAQLGRMAGKMAQRIEAGIWLLKAIQNFSVSKDRYNTMRVIRDYFDNLYAADRETRILLREKWQQSGADQLMPFIQKIINMLRDIIEKLHCANPLRSNE